LNLHVSLFLTSSVRPRHCALSETNFNTRLGYNDYRQSVRHTQQHFSYLPMSRFRLRIFAQVLQMNLAERVAHIPGHLAEESVSIFEILNLNSAVNKR
jgi:hypothetical protein